MSEDRQACDSSEQDAPDDRDYVSVTFDIRKVVIGLFVCWQIFAICVWLLPIGSVPRKQLSPLVADYMLTTGCWQQWTMFSPNPADEDEYIVADLRYADGRRTSFNFYRMHDLSYTARYQRERWRKMTENAQSSLGAPMYPYLARYAAIVKAAPGPGVYPVKVALVQHYRYIPPPPYRPLQFATKTLYTETIPASPLGGGNRR